MPELEYLKFEYFSWWKSGKMEALRGICFYLCSAIILTTRRRSLSSETHQPKPGPGRRICKIFQTTSEDPRKAVGHMWRGPQLLLQKEKCWIIKILWGLSKGQKDKINNKYDGGRRHDITELQFEMQTWHKYYTLHCNCPPRRPCS